MVYVWLTLFIVFVILCWGLNLIGMPGNWLIVVIAVVWVFFGPDHYRFHWGIPVALVVLATIGELIEFLTSVLGTKKLGGSTRGATLMLIGSILFAGVGAWIGSTLGEKWVGKPMKESVKIGGVAFLGRLIGTAGKMMVGSTMVVLAIAAPFVPLLTN